jgi:hypothetical protein
LRLDSHSNAESADGNCFLASPLAMLLDWTSNAVFGAMDCGVYSRNCGNRFRNRRRRFQISGPHWEARTAVGDGVGAERRSSVVVLLLRRRGGDKDLTK